MLKTLKYLNSSIYHTEPKKVNTKKTTKFPINY